MSFARWGRPFLLRRAALLVSLTPLFSSAGCRPTENLVASERAAALASVASVKRMTANAAAPEPVEPNAQAGENKAARPELSAEEEKAMLIRLVAAKANPLPDRDKTTASAAPAGVVVGFPAAPAGASETVTNFGSACGLYLTLTVAGNGAFGRTPAPFSFQRVTVSKQRRISAEDVPDTLKHTGATHALVGTLTGDDAQGTLSYQWYAANSDGKAAPLGQPITLKGTRAQIVAGLPEYARQLQKPLATPDSAFAPGLTADEMIRIGALENAALFSDAQNADLKALAAKSPFASYFAVGCAHGMDNDTAKKAVASTLKTLPLNAIAWVQLGTRRPDLLSPYRNDLLKAEAKYPQNYPLAQTQVWMQRVAGKLDAELPLAEKGVRLAPNNPDAYLSLAWTLSASADAVRQGMPVGFITPQTQAFIDGVYFQWEAAAQRAVDIDSWYGKAWLRLATAATFAGDRSTARSAYDKAFFLEPYNQEVLFWGMQMFQPKWYGDDAKLREVADAVAAAATHGLNSGAVWEQSRTMLHLHLTEPRAKLLDNALAAGDARIARDPKEVQGHYLRAVALGEKGDIKGATEAYQKVIALQPNNSRAHWDLGWFLSEKNHYAEAVPELQAAARLAPDYVEAHAALSHALKELRRLDEAEKAAKDAIAANPKHGDGYDVLGTVYMFQKKPDAAIAAYRKALSISPHYEEAYNNLIVLYNEKKDYVNAAWASENLLRLRPGDRHLQENLGYYYTQTGRDAEAETINRDLIQQNPNYGNYHDNLGIALAHQGKIAEAHEEWDRAIQIGGPPAMLEEIKKMRTKYPRK